MTSGGGDEPIHVRVAQLSSGDVLIGAQAADHELAQQAITRMRRALGVDLDLRQFHDEFSRDPLIGAAVRANPAVRPAGRPDPFEALAWAVTEQLIEYERAAAIQRRMVASLGRRDPESGLRNSPSAGVFAGVAPARLESFDLSGGRAVALVRAAREVALGRVDLDSPDPVVQEAGWRRLRTIHGIGTWTVEILALSGQGRLDQIPAGDLGLIKLVGRLLSGGDPWARASEQQVRDFFARFGRWQGLAANYALRVRRTNEECDDRRVKEQLAAAFGEIGLDELYRRQAEAASLLNQDGVVYNAYRESPVPGRAWRLDPLPAVLSSQEWQAIETGVIERAELLSLILEDIYGPRELLRRRLLPPELVYGHAGFLRASDQIRISGDRQLFLYAVDLGRDDRGNVFALADRSQAPSGAGYALENRTVISRVLPSLYRDAPGASAGAVLPIVAQRPPGGRAAGGGAGSADRRADTGPAE